ncbi:MAG: hypothetical protein IJT48_11205, partial [Bacteroidaceae bacterium]|nr:hypothetical protein [Bacteroidaceae bacterium]
PAGDNGSQYRMAQPNAPHYDFGGELPSVRPPKAARGENKAAGENVQQKPKNEPQQPEQEQESRQSRQPTQQQEPTSEGAPLGPERFAKQMEMQAATQQRMQDFSRRMENIRKGSQPFGDKEERVLNSGSWERAKVSRAVEEARKKADAELAEVVDLATQEVRQNKTARDAAWGAAQSRAREQWRFGRPVSNEAARLRETDLDKLMDEAWERTDRGAKERSINKVVLALEEIYGMGRDEARGMAERIVRGESDRLMYERAVEGEMPRNVLEHMLNKVNGNTIGTLLEGWARAKAGTIGDMQAREEASSIYGKTHRVADIVGGVGAVGLDVATLLAGGLGGGSAKGVMSIGDAAGRKFATKAVGKAVGKAVQGVTAGAVNLAAFEAIGEGANQVKYGGELKVDKDTGRYVVDDYNAGKILSSAGRGALLGIGTGATGAIVGNAFDRIYNGVSSTAGKIGVRTGQTLTSIAAEGTVFALPEFVSGEGDWDTWLESVEMMAGFKVGHAVKTIPQTYDKLRKHPESRAGFETRLRAMLDGEPSLALTRDEREELERSGYGDLAALVEGYKKANQNQREAIERRQPIYLEPNEQGEIPYNRFLELMGDKSVSEAARAKMHYYVSGHKLPQSAIIGTTFTEHTDAEGKVLGYTVEAFGTDRSTIVSRRYKNLKEAEVARDRYNRQAELNGLKLAEGVHDQVHEKMEDGVTAEGVRKEVNTEYGVDIDEAIGKEPNRRSEGEKRAIEEYIRRLAGNEKKDVSLQSDRQLPYGTQERNTENDSESATRPNTVENQPKEDSEAAAGVQNGGGGLRDGGTEGASGRGGRGNVGSVEERLAVELDGDLRGGTYEEQTAYGLQTIEKAKSEGLYIDPSTLDNYGKRLSKGTGESVVYINEANGRVIKVKDPFAKAPMKGNATGDAIYEHLVHNQLFPEDEYRLLGVTEANGEMRLVLEQDYVKFYRNATKEEVEKYLAEELGLQKEGKYWYGNDLLSITDVDAESDNVIVDAEGRLHFIDPIIKLKVPAREVLGAMGGGKSEEYGRGYNADEAGRHDIAVRMAAGEEGSEEAWAGVRQRIEDDADMMIAEERERFNKFRGVMDEERDKDKPLRPVVLKEKDNEGNDKVAYIIDGNVVMMADGTMVDPEASDRSVAIYDPIEDRKRMINPTSDMGVLSLGVVMSAEEFESDLQRRKQAYIQQQLDEASGKVTVQVGEQVQVPGTDAMGTVVAVSEDDEGMTVELSDGTQVPVLRSDLQRQADEAAMLEYQARHQEETPASETQGTVGESQPNTAVSRAEGAPAEFTPDMAITIMDDEG